MSGLPSKDHPLVFFTGGTALRALSAALAQRTSSTVHIVTPFDSGGSSAVLRRTFGMPAIGDIRNRLTALADPSFVPACVLDFLSGRYPEQGDEAELRARLRRLADAEAPVWRQMPDRFRVVLHACMGAFLAAMPETFDARRASLGNLCLTGAYLREGRSLYPVLSLFSRLLRIRGQILPSADENLHLAAELRDGTCLVGQHLFKVLNSPVERLFLTVHEPHEGALARTACRPPAASQALAKLRQASLICYPMGSFYTSVLVNLLPAGYGKTVAAASCPKIFIPNTGHDAEVCGLTLKGQVEILLRTLAADAPQAQPSDFLHCVCIDCEKGKYEGDPEEFRDWLGQKGIRLLDADIVEGDGRHNAGRTADLLLGLCAGENSDER